MNTPTIEDDGLNYQKILKETPLKTRLKVSNEMAFISLLTELGYREEKYWTPDENELLSKLMKAAKNHTEHQIDQIEEWKNDQLPPLTPSNEKYGWVDGSIRLPEDESKKYFIRWKHRLTKDDEWEVLFATPSAMVDPKYWKLEWLSETPSPTGDRDCEELKAGLYKIEQIAFRNNEWAKMAEIQQIAKQLLNL